MVEKGGDPSRPMLVTFHGSFRHHRFPDRYILYQYVGYNYTLYGTV